jgi:hypothetical protein
MMVIASNFSSYEGKELLNQTICIARCMPCQPRTCRREFMIHILNQIVEQICACKCLTAQQKGC